MNNIHWVLKNGMLALSEQRDELFKSLWLYCVVYFLVGWATIDPLQISFFYFVGGLAQSLLMAFIAINIHRVLLGSERLYVGSDFSLSKTESNIRYLVRTFWIFVIIALMFLLFSFISFGLTFFVNSSLFSFVYIGIAVLFISIALFFISPIFLVLPCIAYRQVMTFTQAFKIGKAYRFLLFIVVIVLPALMGFVFGEVIHALSYQAEAMEGIEEITVSQSADYSSLLISYFFYNIVYLVTTMISVAFLSASYAYIKSECDISVKA